MVDQILSFFEDNPIKVSLEYITNCELPHISSQILRTRKDLGYYQDNIEFRDFLLRAISKNFNSEINKIIFKHIHDIGKKSYIDFRKILTPQNSYTNSRLVLKELDLKSQKCIVCNGRIASELDLYVNKADLYVNKAETISVLPYRPLGKNSGFVGKNFWIDPLLKWDDNFILLFDEIRVDVSNQKCYIDNNDPNFGSVIDFRVDFKFDVLNPEVFYIFDHSNDKNWEDLRPILIQSQREEKINQILDEPTEFRPNNQFGIYRYD